MLLLFLFLALLVGGYFYLVKSKPVNQLISNSPTPIITLSPTPTTTPTIIPTVIPTVKPTVLATPKPTVPPMVLAPTGTGYSRFTVSTDRGIFTISLVSIDMNGSKMVTDTGNDSDCSTGCTVMPLVDYVSRNGAFTGIHGTYFCPIEYPDCASKTNSFDFPVYNSRLNKWINGGNLFWNDRAIVYYDGGGMHFNRDAKSFSGGLSAGIVNAPGLIDNGNIIVDSYPLSAKEKSKGFKGGIGIRGNVVYLVVGSNVDMWDMAAIFKALGATHAMNLDGGGSIALIYGGYKAGPGRPIPNAVLFVAK